MDGWPRDGVRRLAIADLEACHGVDVRVAAQAIEPLRRERDAAGLRERNVFLPRSLPRRRAAAIIRPRKNFYRPS
jgi:hypothetical protein